MARRAVAAARPPRHRGPRPRTLDAAAVDEALDDLAADATDASGLNARVAAFADDLSRLDATDRRLLSAARSPVRRAALLAGEEARPAAAAALGRLILRGYLVEVDGVVRLEHPWLAARLPAPDA